MAETLQEFLVNLGFHVDNSGLRSFTNILKGLTKGSVELGLAIEAAATTTVVAVEKMAQNLEKLFFAAERGATSIESIKTFQYGLSQIGVGAEAATQTLEGLAMAMRLNPGNEGLMRALGVQTRTANGQMVDTHQQAMQLVQRLSKMPFFIAAQYAQMFGMSPAQLLMMEDHLKELQQREREFGIEVRQSGVDLQKAGEESHQYMSELRGIGMTVDLLWTKISTTLIEKSLPALKQFHQYLRDHFQDISNDATVALDWIVKVGVELGKLLAFGAIHAFEGVAAQLKFIKGLATAIQQVIEGDWPTALKTAEGAAAGLLSYFRKGFADVDEFLSQYTIYRILKGDALTGITAVEAAMSHLFSTIRSGFADLEGYLDGVSVVYRVLKGQIFGKGIPDWMPDWLLPPGLKRPSLDVPGGGGMPGEPLPPGYDAMPPSGRENRVPMPDPRGFGITPGVGFHPAAFQVGADALRDRLAKDLDLTPEQSSGIVGNLEAESGLKGTAVNPTSGAVGWAQWLGERKRDFLAWAQQNGLDPRSAAANYSFLLHELKDTSQSRYLDAIRSARTAGEAAARFFGFESGGDPRLAFGNRDALADKVNQLPRTHNDAVNPDQHAPVRRRDYQDVVYRANDLMHGGYPGANQTTNEGARALTVSQKVDIHVNGSGHDSVRTAETIADRQRRVNGDLLRNLQRPAVWA